MKVSRVFLIRLKLANQPQYRIAQEAGVSASQLSRLIHGIDRVRVSDERIISVGRLLGLAPSECFAADKHDHRMPAD